VADCFHGVLHCNAEACIDCAFKREIPFITFWNEACTPLQFDGFLSNAFPEISRRLSFTGKLPSPDSSVLLRACFGGHCEAEMPTKLCWKARIDRAIATLATSPGPSDALKTSCAQHRERRKAVNPSATKPSRLVNASWDYLIPSRYEASIRFQTLFSRLLYPISNNFNT